MGTHNIYFINIIFLFSTRIIYNLLVQISVSAGYGDPSYVDHVMRYVGITFRGGTNPNFNNLEAWVTRNPYAQAGLYGQCTWFTW